jgi:cytochrome P450
MAALLDMFEYFYALTTARRKHPTGDLASAIANAPESTAHRWVTWTPSRTTRSSPPQDTTPQAPQSAVGCSL